MSIFSRATLGTEDRFDGQSTFDGQPLQPQWYAVAVKETKPDVRSNGTAKVIAHVLETTGKYTPGRWLYLDMCYEGQNEGYVALGRKIAGSIMDATGVNDLTLTGAELKGKLMAVRVTLQPEEKDPDTNEVTRKARNNVAGIMPMAQLEALRAEHDAKFGTETKTAKPKTDSKPAVSAVKVPTETPAAFAQAAAAPVTAPADTGVAEVPAAFAQQPYLPPAEEAAPAVTAPPVVEVPAVAAPVIAPVAPAPTWQTDGWTQHPSSEPHCYKGQEAKLKTEVDAALAALHAATNATQGAPVDAPPPWASAQAPGVAQ